MDNEKRTRLDLLKNISEEVKSDLYNVAWSLLYKKWTVLKVTKEGNYVTCIRLFTLFPKIIHLTELLCKNYRSRVSWEDKIFYIYLEDPHISRSIFWEHIKEKLKGLYPVVIDSILPDSLEELLEFAKLEETKKIIKIMYVDKSVRE